MNRKSLFHGVVALLLATCLGVVFKLSAWSVHGEMAGETGRSRLFMGKVDPSAAPTNQCLFSIEIEPVMFELNALKDKWKVVRIRVENQRPEPIRLAAEADMIELELAGGALVRGTFDLQSQDSPTWDGLSDEQRKALAYPLSIRGGKPDRFRAEVVYLFAFFPADKVPQVPQRFRYTLQSMGRTVTLQPPPAVAS